MRDEGFPVAAPRGCHTEVVRQQDKHSNYGHRRLLLMKGARTDRTTYPVLTL